MDHRDLVAIQIQLEGSFELIALVDDNLLTNITSAIISGGYSPTILPADNKANQKQTLASISTNYVDQLDEEENAPNLSLLRFVYC